MSSLKKDTDAIREDRREVVDKILSDGFMAFLALLMIPIILLPMFFDFEADVLGFFSFMDWSIIGIFIIEYVSKLYLAENRRKHFLNPLPL